MKKLPCVILLAVMSSPAEAQDRSRQEFPAAPLPAALVNAKWTELSRDPAGDGRIPTGVDGEAFFYTIDIQANTIWFRFQTYGPIVDRPAVSVSLDSDANQSSGISWYGSNKAFTFERMLSVGPREREGDTYRGYNGITDQVGVTARDWINVSSGGLQFHADAATRSYYLGAAITDLGLTGRTMNVIGSVGGNAVWNDDLINTGYATLQLPDQPRP